MPNLAAFHPQIVHFVVAGLILGVAFRLVSLTGRLTFTNYAAAILLLVGTVAAALAVQSGTDAHGPVERIPGARAMVMKHEDLGKDTRNIFLGVAALELLAFGFASNANLRRYGRYAHFASAIVGLWGMTVLYEAAEHGGELVYSYAGGPGLRTGDAKDNERLLLAGLYNQSRADRKAGRLAESAQLMDVMIQRFSADTAVRFLHVESLLLDKKDYPAAQSALDSITVAPTDARLASRKGTLQTDIYLAEGKPDSARAVMQALVTAFPKNTRLKAKLDSIK